MDPRQMTQEEREAHDTFSLGDFELDCGVTLPNAILAYKTWGTLAPAKDNVIVYPTAFGGKHPDADWFIGPDMALNPAKYFIIVINMFGSGLSSSPTNTPEPFHKGAFPKVTVQDLVRAQHQLVTQQFGIEKIALVTGGSMGAMQTFQWGVSYPDMVERLLPFCGSASCSPHNYVFLEGIKAALTTDAAFKDGFYESPPTAGLKALGRVWAGWAMSQPFYTEEKWRDIGFKSLDEFLTGFWENFGTSHDANNMLMQLWTWQNGCVGKTKWFNGDRKKALAAINAKTIVLPAERDLYFPVEDQAEEVTHMPSAELRVIPGVWGHMACVGLCADDAKFIDNAAKELLAS